MQIHFVQLSLVSSQTSSTSKKQNSSQMANRQYREHLTTTGGCVQNCQEQAFLPEKTPSSCIKQAREKTKGEMKNI